MRSGKYSFFGENSKRILLKAIKNKQSIVIGGETGAGKTELQKYLLMRLEPSSRVIVIDNVEEFLKNRSEQLNNPSIESLLESLIDYRLMFYLLDYISLNKDKLYNSLTEEEKNNLISVLTNNKYRALEVGDLDSSQVSIGGLKLTNINPNNFESNIVSNLYIIGEALDVAGICGGYNIAFAFISGFIVGCHLC